MAQARQGGLFAGIKRLNAPLIQNLPRQLCPTAALPKPQNKVQNEPEISRKEVARIKTETIKREEKLPSLTVVRSAVSLFSWEDMQNIAPVKINNEELQGMGSVNDPRMGVVSFSAVCQYCSQIDCPGHFGLIEFGIPIYNPIVIRKIVSILICVCNDCGRLLINEEVIKQQGFNRLSHERRLAEMEKYCKKVEGCLRPKRESDKPCNANPTFVITDLNENGVILFKTRKSGSKKKKEEVAHRLLPVKEVSMILDRISFEDAKLLGFSANDHPRNMLIRGILVSPIIARPPVYEGGMIHHDQLTYAFRDIFRRTKDVAARKPDADKELYKEVRHLIFKTEGRKTGPKEFLSIIERIQGKQALLRGLLMGKRVNYCGRTVAGPEPSIEFGQVRIPEVWAKTLTKKVKVNDINISYLSQLLREGKITNITSHRDRLRKFYDPKKSTINYLEVGDVVDRWLQNGDRTVINRQPTLHRQSMMAYQIVLGKQLTIGLHLSVTTPMNCDFDGDENNKWNPQDVEVDAEIDNIMNVTLNVMSAEQNRPIMGLVMNSILGSYLMTSGNVVVDDRLFKLLINGLTNKSGIPTLYNRLMKYGIDSRSGSALYSVLFPVDFYYNQGGVVILEGVLFKGTLTKKNVGTSNRSIIQELWKKYGSKRTKDFFTDAPRLIGKWLMERGFSVGIEDCVSLGIDEKGNEYDKNKRVLDTKLALLYIQLEALGPKNDDPQEEEYRHRKIINLVNVTEGIGLNLAKESMKNNSIGMMTDQGSGAKGGLANIGQMFGAVGQQNYHGDRLQPGITNRTRLLPTFDENEVDPVANAFLPQSFFTGLTPEGLFFLQEGGREGLLDTALKTQETGTISRRMVKAFENIVIGYDGSVRNTAGTLFSPIYNSGYDISELIKVDEPGKIDFSSFIDLKETVEELNMKHGWIKAETNSEILKKRNSVPQRAENVLPVSETYSKFVTRIEVKTDLSTKLDVTQFQNKFTKYEKARVIGTRATQIANNAKPMIDIGDEIDDVNIATLEYEAGILPIYVIRHFSDGSIETVGASLENI